MSTDPTTWRVGNRIIAPHVMDDDDERGILWVWEEPRRYATYVVSLDPTVGRPGWSREFRTEADIDTDNAAIEVFRAGRGGQPDVQVAEFAAPVDAIDIAPIAATIGMLYAGDHEDGQALIIGELNGPGSVTLRELMDKFNYSHLWQWQYYAQAVPRRANQFWWWSSPTVNKDLWMRGLHHIQKYRCVLNSKWLIEEMADCVADTYRLIGEARFGRHDDRVVALLLNMWCVHDWSTREDVEPLERPVDTSAPKWEASDISYEQMCSNWDDRVADLLDD